MTRTEGGLSVPSREEVIRGMRFERREPPALPLASPDWNGPPPITLTEEQLRDRVELAMIERWVLVVCGAIAGGIVNAVAIVLLGG